MLAPPFVSSFVPCSFSQADVKGSESACCFIAAMSCVQRIHTGALSSMELCIFQGGKFYSAWKRSAKREAYAHTREALATIAPAAPLVEVDEHGGKLWFSQGPNFPSLDEALFQTIVHQHTIVVIGVYSFALFRTELGGYELFDSHAQLEFGGKAVLLQFDSLAQLLSFLRMRYPYSGTDYSVTYVVAAQEQHALQYEFQDEALAWEAVDSLPGGSALFNVWKHRDTLVVASVYDFTSKDNHCLVLRYEKQRVFFHARIRGHVVDAFKEGVKQQWRLERGRDCSNNNDFVVVPSGDGSLDIFHSDMWFVNMNELDVFLRRASPLVGTLKDIVIRTAPLPCIGYYTASPLISVPLPLVPLAHVLAERVAICIFKPSGRVFFTMAASGSVMEAD
jgi:hypothetical protein